jgi:hypothetical protein
MSEGLSELRGTCDPSERCACTRSLLLSTYVHRGIESSRCSVRYVGGANWVIFSATVEGIGAGPCTLASKDRRMLYAPIPND